MDHIYSFEIDICLFVYLLSKIWNREGYLGCEQQRHTHTPLDIIFDGYIDKSF